jgi:hypothetical protein
MKATRREFGALGIAGFAAMLGEGAGGIFTTAPAMAAGKPLPWYLTVKRLGQTNFNERDPEHGDVEAWADYWSSVGVQAVILSVSGPVAFYPTKVPYFHISAYLNGRDLFGDCVTAARKRGMRVVGRMSPDIQYIDAALLASHPQWFRRTRDGELQSPAPDIAYTCQFSGQFTEQQPKILRELNARYDIDGVYMNGWPTLQVCYCDTCRKIGDPTLEKYRKLVMDDAARLVDVYRGIVLEKNRNNFYSCNIAGGIEETEIDLWELTRKALWFTSDNQARPMNMPVWQAAQQVKFARSLMGDRAVAAVSAGYARSGVTWRQVSNTSIEPVSRMAQTAAAGGIVWYHQLGLKQGFADDRRWQKNGQFLSWMAANDRHFQNRRSLANVAIIVPSRTMAHYRPELKASRTDSLQGMYALLNQARIPFDLIHENDLGAARLKPYDLLILPNFAFMSDSQAASLRDYAQSGGSLLATFETGLYDEAGNARGDFALAELFGIAKTGPARLYQDDPSGIASFYVPSTIQLLRQQSELTKGFDDTNSIAGPSRIQPIKPRSDAVMTFIEPYPAYPPEAVFQRAAPTDMPSLVVQERGATRVAYLAGDMDATFWRSDNQDLARQMSNTISWLLRGKVPVSVSGEGLLEVIGWATEPGYAVHLLNYNGPNAFRGFMKEPVSIGEQVVRVTLPDDRPIRRANLLWVKQDTPFSQNERNVELRVPKLGLYEVIALEY